MAKKYTTDSITVGGHNLTASMMESLNIVVSNYTNYLTTVPSHNQAWSTITGTPTTLAGYGITDGLSSEHDHDGTYVNITGDTMTGDLIIQKTNPLLKLVDSNTSTGNYPAIEFETSNSQGVRLEHNEFDSELPIAGYGLVLKESDGNSQFPSAGTLSLSVLGEIYAGATTLGSLNKVFHDGYHPNADKWTTARTITLGGDLTGSVSLDGSANVTLSAQVVNNSHTHDDRYYTESEIDTLLGGKLSTTGKAADSNLLDGIDSSQFLRSDANDSFTGNELHFPTLDLSISNNNSQNQGNTYFRGNSTHFVLGLNGGNTLYLNYGNSAGQFRAYGNGMHWNDVNIGTPWGSSNDGSGSGLDADTLDGQHASAFLTSLPSHNHDADYVNVSGDTMTGTLTIDTGGNSSDALVIKGAAPTISLLDDDGGDDFYIHVNSNNFYVLANRDANDLVGTGWESPHPLQLEADTNIGYLFGARIFTDNYHPDASKWTTARTITIGNTGKSVDGSANVSWSLAEIGAQPAGTYNTIIGTDTDINTSGSTIIDNIYVTDGVITSMGTRTLTAGDIGAAYYDHFRSLGVPAFTAGGGSNSSTTTSQLITEMENDGAFDSYTSAFKTSWSYASNDNLTDAGRFTETAGTSWLTWTDNSSDSTRGNITALAIAPTTGGSAGKVFIYNDQGSGYAPGWREVWTSTSDGSGSGLDADLLDGNHASAFATASHNHDSTYLGITAKAADSNLLDGIDSGSFLRSDAADTATGTISFAAGVNIVANPLRFQRSSTSQTGQDDNVSVTVDDSNIYFTHNNDADGDASGFNFRYSTAGTTANLLNFSSSSLTYKGNTIWHSGNDGSGSGLDADTLDGQHASAFLTSLPSHNHDSIYVKKSGDTMTGNLSISKNNPVLVLNETTSTSDADQVAYISFQDNGAEEAWIGWGSNGNSNLTIRNSIGSVVLDGNGTTQINDNLDLNGNADISGTLTVPNLTIGSGNKIKFANNDYIRYDDTNGVGRFHFDADGGTNNASVQAATFVGALSTTGISGSNYNITGVNQLEINDPGEGIVWKAGSSGDITLAVVDDSSDNILRLSGSGAKLEVAGGHITATGGSSNAKNIKLYVNDSWGYLTTSAPRFYLDKEIRVDTGLIGSYDEDLHLRTSGSTRMTLKNSGGNVGINTTTPDAKLEVDGGIMPYKTLRLTDSTTPGIYFNDLTGTAAGDGNFIVASTGGNLYFSVDTNYDDLPSSVLATLNEGGNFTLNEGALIVNGSTTRGTYTLASQYHSGADNIVLKGNSSGISTIFFESEKDGTNINHASDFGFIQFHPYGTGTSGESNELIIGVSNDSDDHVILNAPNAEGFRVRVGSSETDYKIYHEGHKPTASEIGAQPAGTYNTIIGTDADITTSGATVIDDIYMTDGVITSHTTRTLTPGDIGAATSSHNHTYNVNDSWLRDNGDNANVKLYGNSRQMVFRTDGTTEYSSGVGGYPFAWMYGGNSASDRKMLLSTGGDLWTSTSGWLSAALAGKASVSHTHNYAGSTSSGGSATRADKLDFTGYGSDGVTSYQTSGNWQTWTGGWATHIIGNHGNGSTYYNQTLIMPFWGAPQYMRKEGGTNVGPYKFWTEENDGSGSGLDADTLDGIQGANFLRSDTSDTMTGNLTLNNGGSGNLFGYDQYHYIKLRDGGANWITLGDYGGIRFFTGNNSTTLTEKVQIAPNGNVGIGTTNPTYKLHVAGDIYTSAYIEGSYIAANNGLECYGDSYLSGYISNDSGAEFYDTVDVYAPVYATAFYTSSDESLKTNVQELPGNTVNVNWKSFEFKEKEGETRVGVIAQELEQNHPEFVSTSKNGFKTVNYIELLIAKIAELETRIKQLENNG